MTVKRSCSIAGCGRDMLARGYCNAHYQRFFTYGDPLGGGTQVGAPLRFIMEVAIHHVGNECLTWPYAKGDGYGRVNVDGKKVVASRYICELAHGAPPTPEHDAAHSCGKGHLGCVAPGHLSWKTRAENFSDKLEHGTHNRGERNVGAKLSESDVREIRTQSELSQREMAERFGVSQSLISRIRSGCTWAWLSEEVNGGAS